MSMLNIPSWSGSGLDRHATESLVRDKFAAGEIRRQLIDGLEQPGAKVGQGQNGLSQVCKLEVVLELGEAFPLGE